MRAGALLTEDSAPNEEDPLGEGDAVRQVEDGSMPASKRARTRANDAKRFPYVFVSCALNDKKMHYVLVDSAAPTCITYDTLTRIFDKPALEKTDIVLQQWAGHTLQVRGVVRLNFKLDEWRVDGIPVLVVDSAPSSFIIGNDLMSRTDSTRIDWRAETIQFGPYRPVQFYSPTRIDSTRDNTELARGHRTVHVLHNYVVQPWRAAYVQVFHTLPAGKPQSDQLWLFEPEEHTEENHHVMLEKGVVSHVLTSAVWVQNLSDNEARFFAGDIMGTLVPLEEVLQPVDATDEVWAAALLTADVGGKDRTADDIAEPPLEPREPPKAFDISPDVPPEEYARLERLLKEVCLVTPAIGVGQSRAEPMQLRLKPGAVINNRNYPQRIEAQLEAMKIAEKMHAGGVLRRSVSPYNSPVVLARKPDGTWRFCVDYRQVNAATIRDAYQLPRPNDLLARLGGASIFSVLDLASAFWQVRLAEEAKQFTAFSLLSGHWEFEFIPMGLSGSPPWMQRSLEGALGDILYRGALAYIDDIIVYASTWDEHYERLKTVLKRLRDFGFHTRQDKCRFGYRQVKFLGHLVSAEGMRPADRNISKIRDCHEPTDTKQLESCLALFSYYRRFIRGYADLARPLVKRLTHEQDLVRRAGKNPRRIKRQMTLTEDERKNFEEIKARLCAENNLLVLPDWECGFVLETDSSDYFGHATLSQYEPNSKTRLRPVEFHSFELPQNLWKQGAYEREFKCVTEGVKYFSSYLDYTQAFEVRIDHNALKYLHSQRINPKYARWVQVLGAYNIKWVYQPGHRHGHIDCFTRPPFTDDIEKIIDDADRLGETQARIPVRTEECLLCKENGDDPYRCNLPIVYLHALPTDEQTVLPAAAATTAPSSIDEGAQHVPLPRTPKEIAEQQRADSYFGAIYEYLASLDADKTFPDEVVKASDRFLLGKNGLLYHLTTSRRSRGPKELEEQELPLAIPATLTGEFLKAYHVDSTSAHLGFKKAFLRLSRECYWPKMSKDLLDFEFACDSCMRHKLPRRGAVGELHSISATAPWEVIGMDIFGPLPPTRRGYAYVIIFMDYLSRYVIIRPLRTQTASEVARVLVKEVFLNRAPPQRLLSDRGSAFLSDLMHEVYKTFGVFKVNTSAYHPQTDGMVERFNHTLASMLAHYVSEELNDWDDYLLAVQHAYNTATHASMQHSPHEVLHGWVARTPTLAPLGSPLPPIGEAVWLERLKKHMSSLHKLVIELDKAAKEKNEERYNAASTKVTFHERQLVFRKNERLAAKFDAKLLGPYIVLKAKPDRDVYLIRAKDDTAAIGEWVHAEKLFPQRTPYIPDEVDRQEDEDAEDADEPEFRPDESTMAQSSRPLPTRRSVTVPLQSVVPAAPSAPAAKEKAAPPPSAPPALVPLQPAVLGRAPRGGALPMHRPDLATQLRSFQADIAHLDLSTTVPSGLYSTARNILDLHFREGQEKRELKKELRSVGTVAELVAVVWEWINRYPN